MVNYMAAQILHQECILLSHMDVQVHCQGVYVHLYWSMCSTILQCQGRVIQVNRLYHLLRSWERWYLTFLYCTFIFLVHILYSHSTSTRQNTVNHQQRMLQMESAARLSRKYTGNQDVKQGQRTASHCLFPLRLICILDAPQSYDSQLMLPQGL